MIGARQLRQYERNETVSQDSRFQETVAPNWMQSVRELIMDEMLG